MATYTWNTATGSYNVATNWAPSGPPTSGDTANFGAGTGTISGTGAAATLNVSALGNWSFAGQVSAGAMNDLGSVTILNGGVLTSTNTQFGVGNALNATGTLTVNAGGQLLSTIPAQTALNELTVANYNGSTGTVTVSGTGALINMGANGAGIGNAGNGTLTVSNGGTVQLATSNSNQLAALSSGNNAGSQASITVTGASSSISAAGYVYIGRAGTAQLTVSNGGTFTGGAAGTSNGQSIAIGDGTFASSSTSYFGGTATANVTGSGSKLHSLNQLRVGYRGTTGSLTVAAGGAAVADFNVVVGGGSDRTGGKGTLLVQSGGTVTSGGQHSTGNAGIVFGNDVGTTGTGTVDGSGSLLNANGDRLTIGSYGTGSLTVSGGGRVLAGANYSDVEAALAVASASGGTGTLVITGTGSALTATGDAVIGGNEKGAGPFAGGTGSASVNAGGTLSVSGTLTVQAGGSLSVDGGSTLTAPAVVINGGAVTMGVMTSANAFSFGAGGTLSVGSVSGSNTVGGFGFGDVIDLLGTTNATLSGTTVTTGSGSITLGAAPANASYSLISDGNGGTDVVVSPQTIGVYRFFDATFGTHFYTASADEARAVAAARSDLLAEGPGGIGLQAVAVQASDPNAAAVYRFFDNVHGTHFFTASADERDTVIANRTDLVYEATSTFYEHTTKQVGDTAVYRFFDTKLGTHFYTDSESERASIVANRPDLTAEGIGFYEPKQNYAT